MLVHASRLREVSPRLHVRKIAKAKLKVNKCCGYYVLFRKFIKLHDYGEYLEEELKKSLVPVGLKLS